MKVAVTFNYDADIIDCPEELLNNLGTYKIEFLNWLFDKQNEHSYWMYKNGKKVGCMYRSEAFIEWLNKFVQVNSPNKAKLLESRVHIKNLDKSLLRISF